MELTGRWGRLVVLAHSDRRLRRMGCSGEGMVSRRGVNGKSNNHSMSSWVARRRRRGREHVLLRHEGVKVEVARVCGTMPVPVVLATEGLYMSGAEENMVAVPKPVQNIERSAGRDTDMQWR